MSLGSPDHGETVFDWLAVLLAVVLAGIHLYVAVSNDEQQFFIVAGMFVLGVLFFFTNYWRAVIYLLAALYVGILGVLWFLGGMQYWGVGLLTGVLSVTFIGLVIYLFFAESEVAT
jgi:hypothetical protein